MSKLEKLIQQYCPDGVEYKRTEDIATTLIGEFVHKNKQREGAPYPVYNGGSSNTGFYDEYNREANCIIVSARGANAGFVNKITTRFWSGNSCYTIIVNDKNLLWTFAYYWFKSNERRLLGEQQKGGIPAISKKQIEDFKIPVPPLPVQEEIVRVLDTFTELQAELQAELQKRKQQYNYYLDNLLNFKNINRGGQEIKWMMIGEICNVITGGEVPVDSIKGDTPQGDFKYPIWGNGKDIYGYSATYQITQDAVCISSIGANTGAVFFHSAYFTPIIRLKVLIPLSKKVSTKYLFYILSTIGFDVKKSSVPNMNSTEVKQKRIPIPPLAEQQKIVSILDRFDTLTNDLTSGLPAEMEKRRQQYEFYRDKLLTFKRKEA